MMLAFEDSAASSALQNYLDRQLGKTSIALSTSSSVSFSAEDVDGSGNLSEGSLSIVAQNCPGPSCALRLNDFYARAADLDVDAVFLDLLGIEFSVDVDVNNVRFTNVKPTTLDANADGSFQIPANGLEMMAAFTVEGNRSRARVLNANTVNGALNFGTGAFSLSATVALDNANLNFNFNGSVTNFAPTANAGPDQTLECSGVLTPVTLDGSGSSDGPPGAGIVGYGWYLGFDRGTGAGTLAATGVSPTVQRPISVAQLSLLDIDGEGAAGLDDVLITVQDTTPPVITAANEVTLTACNSDARTTFPLPVLSDVCHPPEELDLVGVVVESNGATVSVPIVDGKATVPAGRHVVRWTATDPQHNSSEFLQTVRLDSCWPMYGRVSGRSRTSPFVGPATNARQFVFHDAHLNIKSSPAVATDGTIYVGSNDSRVYAVNPAGTKKWEYRTDGPVNSSPAVGFGGFVWVGSDDDYLYKLDPASGAVACRRKLGDRDVNSSPAVGSDGTIYVGSDADRLYAINAADCTIKWSVLTGGDVDSSPAVRLSTGNDRIFVGSDDNRLYAVSQAGAVLWSFATGNDIDSSPALSNDGAVVFVGSDDHHLHALNANTGAEIWKRNLGADVESAPAVGPSGRVYVGSQLGDFFALDPATGAVVWSRDLRPALFGSAAVDHNEVVFVGVDEKVYAFDGNNLGTTIWSFETDGDVDSSPALGLNGTLYVGSDDNDLYAFGPGQTTLGLPFTPGPDFAPAAAGDRVEPAGDTPRAQSVVRASGGCNLGPVGGGAAPAGYGLFALFVAAAAATARRRRQ